MMRLSGALHVITAYCAFVSSASAELFGIGLVIDESGALKHGPIAVGQLDTSGSALAYKKDGFVVTASVPGVHILDAMTSGCGLVVANRTAYTVGYSCATYSSACQSASSMRLFGIDVEVCRSEREG